MDAATAGAICGLISGAFMVGLLVWFMEWLKGDGR